MSDKLSSLKRRLAKVERAAADSALREQLANCNCRDLTVAWTAEEFEAMMKVSCPAHGFRLLGRVQIVSWVAPDGTRTDRSKIDQLLETYEAGARHARQELQNDPEES